MADDDEAPESEDGGVPGWVVTFSDLMSLLLAFFVLLFSFSEVDKAKYKQVGGSMKEAFGVQRKIKVREQVMGINHIGQEFSSGRPDKRILNVVEQETVRQLLRHLAVREARESSKDMLAGDGDVPDEEDKKQQGEEDSKGEGEKVKEGIDVEKENQVTDFTNRQKFMGDDGKKGQDSVLEDGQMQGTEKWKGNQGQKGGDGDMAGMGEKWQEFEGYQGQQSEQGESEQGEGKLAGGGMSELKKQAGRDGGDQGAGDLARAGTEFAKQALQKEIEEGLVEVLSDGKKVVIRVKERGSFPPGGADMLEPMVPFINKVGQVLSELGGEVTIAGHTDDRPISNSRFRSNWDLSAARAVTLVHGLIKQTGMDSTSFTVQGFGDTRPVDDNATAEGRARNRRVEIEIVQGKDTLKTMEKAYKDRERAAELARELGLQVMEDEGNIDGDVVEDIPNPDADKPKFIEKPIGLDLIFGNY